MNYKKTVLLFSGLVVLAGASSVWAQDSAAVKFTKVVFTDNFDGYMKDKPLPAGAGWSSIAGGPSEVLGAYIREDVDGVFGSDKKTQYLQMLDNSGEVLRVIAADIKGLDSKLVRLSFDGCRPKGDFTGAVAIKMGRGNISSKPDNEAVGWLQIEKDGRLMPAGSGLYSPGAKFHVDIYFNETKDAVAYLTADGQESRLRPGLMDIWVDGRLKGAGSKAAKRDAPESTAIKSLRLETFSTDTSEMWLDNLEIAIPE
jgi:hypothetical protein